MSTIKSNIITILFILAILIVRPAYAGDTWEVSVQLSDEDVEQEVLIGTDLEATVYYDEGLDQLAPPSPPSEEFDARILGHDDEFLTYFRPYEFDKHTFELSYRPGETSDHIVLKWDRDNLADGWNFIITSPNDEDFEWDMRSEDELSTSESDDIIDGLKITAYPKEDHHPFSDGEGTAEDPYEVETAQQLQAVSDFTESHFIQTDNINLSEIENFSPIGDPDTPFSGSFDGGEYIISNLNVNRSEQDFIGLFGLVEQGEIHQVGLDYASVYGNDHVGALVGLLHDGEVSESYVIAEVTGNKFVGSFAGTIAGTAQIYQSYGKGEVYATAIAGGFIGSFEDESHVDEAFSSVEIQAEQNTGGFAGRRVNDAILTAAYFNYDLANEFQGVWNGSSVGVIRLKDDILMTGSRAIINMGLLDYDEKWNLTDGFPALNWEVVETKDTEFPFTDGDGTESSPFKISTVDEFDHVRNYLFAHFELAENIDFESVENWEPIADNITPFSGVFDGNGYKIDDLNIEGSSGVGLFRYVAGVTARAYINGLVENQNYDAIIQNIDLTNVDVNGTGETGSLIGIHLGGEVYNVSSSGNVYGGWGTGGLIGINSGTISDAKFEGQVTGDQLYTGGLVGYMFSGDLTDSSIDGNVIGQENVGGAVGYLEGSISNVEAYGDVEGELWTGGIAGTVGFVGNFTRAGHVSSVRSNMDISGNKGTGGIVGWQMLGEISDTYSHGEISGQKWTGGIVGIIQPHEDDMMVDQLATIERMHELLEESFEFKQQSEIEAEQSSNDTELMVVVQTSYATGSIIGDSSTGGIAGENQGDLFSTYWDTEASGIDEGVGAGDSNETHGLETSQMTGAEAQQNLQGFSFYGDNNRWLLKENDYPALSWEDIDDPIEAESPFAGGDGTENNPYQVSDSYQLGQVRYSPEAYFEQISDIDLSEVKNFSPIGNFDNPFKGYFNGADFLISDLTISYADGLHTGLFGVTEGAELKNINLIDIEITGDWNTAGLTGAQLEGEISNVYVDGKVDGRARSGGVVGWSSGNVTDAHADVVIDGVFDSGGLVGLSNEGRIYGSISTGEVSATGNRSGGLVGWMSNSASEVHYSYAKGDVTSEGDRTGGLIGDSQQGMVTTSYASGDVSGNIAVAALVGNSFEGRIYQSYAEGNATGEASVGGVAGWASGEVLDTYATGNIEGHMNTGGVIGYYAGIEEQEQQRMSSASEESGINPGMEEDSDASISPNVLEGENDIPENSKVGYTYAAGEISAENNAGGVIGYNTDDSEITSSYWDTETTGMESGAGDGSDEGIEGLTTSEMQQSENFTDWDFEEIWSIDEGESYPYMELKKFIDPTEEGGWVQVIHNSDDPSVDDLSLYVNDESIKEEFDFRTSSQFIEVPSIGETNIELQNEDQETVLDTTFNADAESYYQFIASGVNEPDFFAENPDGKSIDLQFIMVDDVSVQASSEDDINLRLVHGVSDAPAVNAEFRDFEQTINPVGFGSVSNEITIPADQYEVDVYDQESEEWLEAVALELEEYGGEVFTLIASGFLNPDENSDREPLGVVVVDHEGGVTETETITSSPDETGQEVPDEVSLSQNYPNPFNPTTTIEYAIPEDLEVRLEIYNVLGQRVTTLVDESRRAGTHNVEWDASEFASGVYIYRLQAGDKTITQEMTLVK